MTSCVMGILICYVVKYRHQKPKGRRVPAPNEQLLIPGALQGSIPRARLSVP